MASAPHLLTEDRPDFDRVLDEALHIVLGDLSVRADTRSSQGRRSPGGAGSPLSAGSPLGTGSPLNAEQLRTLAIAAYDVIGAAAAEEYAAYRTIREQARESARQSAESRDSRKFGFAAMGVAEGAGSGAGLVAAMAVLTPILAGSAAVVLLLIGYALEAASPEPGVAAPLRTAGWFFAAVTAGALLLGGIGLVLAALRNGSSAVHDVPDAMPHEVAVARTAWHDALLNRGILPFLDDALADARSGGAAPTAPPARSATRIPHLGYSSPDFSSPEDPTDTAVPHFSSPDFSSPDFTSPDFTSPDFTGPDRTTGSQQRQD